MGMTTPEDEDPGPLEEPELEEEEYPPDEDGEELIRYGH